jgi:hypothetical protein
MPHRLDLRINRDVQLSQKLPLAMDALAATAQCGSTIHFLPDSAVYH